MAGVRTVRELPTLTDPVLVEGLPGVGLVGKIAADHLVDSLEMAHVATIECEGIPEVAVFPKGDRTVIGPVRVYVDDDGHLLVLQSDVPVSRTAASGFATCVTSWISDHDVFPVYLSGRPRENDDPGELPSVTGVGVGGGRDRLDAIDVGLPTERGAIGGPTGALLRAADRRGLDAAGVVVDTDPRFPDPAGARRLLVEAIEPLADVSVDTESLVERAEDIQEQRETLARKMREAAEEESSQAQPIRGFQ